MINLITDNKRLINEIEHDVLNQEPSVRKQVVVEASQYIEVNDEKYPTDSKELIGVLKSLHGLPTKERYVRVHTRIEVTSLIDRTTYDASKKVLVTKTNEGDELEQLITSPYSERKTLEKDGATWREATATPYCYVESDVERGLEAIAQYNELMVEDKHDLAVQVLKLMNKVDILEQENHDLLEETMGYIGMDQ